MQRRFLVCLLISIPLSSFVYAENAFLDAIRAFGTGEYGTRPKNTDTRINNPYVNRLQQTLNIRRCNEGLLSGFNQGDCTNLNKKTDDKLGLLEQQCKNLPKDTKRFASVYNLFRNPHFLAEPMGDRKNYKYYFAMADGQNNGIPENEINEYKSFVEKVQKILPKDFLEGRRPKIKFLEAVSGKQFGREGGVYSQPMFDFSGITREPFLRLNKGILGDNNELFIQVLTHEIGHVVTTNESKTTRSCGSDKLAKIVGGACGTENSEITKYYNAFCTGQNENYKGYTSAYAKQGGCAKIAEDIAESFRVWVLWCFLSDAEKKQMYRSDIAAKILFFELEKELRPELGKYKQEIVNNIVKSGLLK